MVRSLFFRLNLEPQTRKRRFQRFFEHPATAYEGFIRSIPSIPQSLIRLTCTTPLCSYLLTYTEVLEILDLLTFKLLRLLLFAQHICYTATSGRNFAAPHVVELQRACPTLSKDV